MANATNETCEPTLNYKLYVHFSLIPAFFVIYLLSLFTKRVHRRECWGGIPGLLVPVNLISQSNKRLAITLAFGAATGSFIPLLIQDQNYIVDDAVGVSRWVVAISKLFIVFELGVIYFPIFLCQTFPTEGILVPLLGFLYTVPKPIVELYHVLECPIMLPITKDISVNAGVLEKLPVIICLIYISIHFLFTLYCAIYDHIQNRNINFQEFGARNVNHLRTVAGQHDYYHVRKLLSRPIPEHPKAWYKRIVEICRYYEFKKDFKLPVQISATVIVSSILVYQVEIAYLLLGYELYKQVQVYINQVPSGATARKLFEFLQDLSITIMVTSIIASIHIIILIVGVIKNYRESVFKIWAGNREFLPKSLPSPAGMVRLSLRYSGYQFAHIFWGFVFINLVFVITGCVICTIIFYWSEINPYMIVVWDFAAPLFVAFVILWLTQYFLAFVVFRDYGYPNISININNPRLFHIANYFFFFYGFLVGIWGAMARGLKSFLLNLLMFPRIDHNILLQGLHRFDNGYMAYLGFLFVSASLTNPTMLVFCQILLDKSKVDAGIEITRPRVSKKAFNQWFLVLQLAKNPALIQYRKYIRYPELLVNQPSQSVA